MLRKKNHEKKPLLPDAARKMMKKKRIKNRFLPSYLCNFLEGKIEGEYRQESDDEEK